MLLLKAPVLGRWLASKSVDRVFVATTLREGYLVASVELMRVQSPVIHLLHPPSLFEISHAFLLMDLVLKEIVGFARMQRGRPHMRMFEQYVILHTSP